MSETVRCEVNSGVLILYFSGRVDTVTSGPAEERIKAFRAENRYEGVIIDAEELTYISSAGLRVVLRLRKEEPELKIINASPEVYDILEMTGFTEMLPVEKAYRRLTVEGCEVIGKGSNGEVYRLDEDTIIKVYLNPEALQDIKRERELARKAFVLGIPTAIPYDVVKVGDTYGSVFELLNARSLTNILDSEPDRFDEVVDIYVDLLKKIHSTTVKKEDMPCMKDTVRRWVADVRNILDAGTWEKLNALVEAVPDNYHMIHGDYHTKNVMVQNGEVLLIDMDTLCYGDPVFEFASVFNAYIGFYAGMPTSNGKTFIGLDSDVSVRVWEETVRRYFGTKDPVRIADITDKSALIGYTRLLRRTVRRMDTADPAVKKTVAYYVGQITDITKRVDDLDLGEIKA